MAVIRGQQGGGPGTLDGAGWIYVGDVATQAAGTVTTKVWQDPPGNTILQSCTSSSPDLRVTIRASYPVVDVDGTAATLTRDGSGAFYTGQVDITVAGSGDVLARVFTGDNEEGDRDTVAVTVDAPPTILTLSFTGSYPGSQTELKQGDTFQITGTTDKAIDRVEIQNYQACQFDSIVAAGTAFTVSGTIADRGDTAVLRPARVRTRDAVTGAFGPTRDTDQGGGSVDGQDVVLCNDLRPSIGFGAKDYPGTQLALKGSETATVINSVSFYDTVLYDSPTSELSITNPATVESPKTVERIAGGYNVSTNNLRITANRAANDATTISGTVVSIANDAVAIDVLTPAARLRSGGLDGTSAQNHTITIQATQNLLFAPQLDQQGPAGTFLGSWVGGGSIWTRTLQVQDTDPKGTFAWQNAAATNLAGITTNSIASGANYTLGGFVARAVTFAAFVQTATLNVPVSSYAKLTAGIFTATNQPSNLNPVQGNVSDLTDTWTVLSPIGTAPITIWWNDVAAASSNSSGTAQLLDIQETV
jgi:hypothetical protein